MRPRGGWSSRELLQEDGSVAIKAGHDVAVVVMSPTNSDPSDALTTEVLKS